MQLLEQSVPLPDSTPHVERSETRLDNLSDVEKRKLHFHVDPPLNDNHWQ